MFYNKNSLKIVQIYPCLINIFLNFVCRTRNCTMLLLLLICMAYVYSIHYSIIYYFFFYKHSYFKFNFHVGKMFSLKIIEKVNQHFYS